MLGTIISFFIFSVSIDHDFKIAHYRLSESEGEIQLSIRIDRYDFLNAIGTCSEESSKCYSNYFQKHLSFKFNGKEMPYTYLSHEIKRDFIELEYMMGYYDGNVEEIYVFNDVLLEKYLDQDNIVISTFHDKRRSFRLNKGRLETTISY